MPPEKHSHQSPVRPARSLVSPAARAAFALSVSLLAAPAIGANDAKSLNVYSARHYQTDDALYARFTELTGIKVNRLEAGDSALIERLRSEGDASPADVLLLADASRLWKAETDGLFRPIRSTLLEKRIPAELRGADDDGGIRWFGFSRRARLIVYDPSRVAPDAVRRYEDLAADALKGKVCTRSGAHPYMLSLIGAMILHLGDAKAETWAKGVVGNFARKPRGGDTDQIKGIASGECAVALTNSYYLVRLMRSKKPADQQVVAKVRMVWPNQDSWGTHVNVSGGGVLRHAPHPQAAVRFLEFLASDEAQRHFADGNNEWTAVKSVSIGNAELRSLGEFRADDLPLAKVGRAQLEAVKLIDRVGWR